MPWQLRKLTAKDIASIHLGKRRAYRLTRGENSVVFTGTLLAHYHENLSQEEKEAQVSNYLDVIALFKTEKQQYFLYYEVSFNGIHKLRGQQSFVTILKSLDDFEPFLDKMKYTNGNSFKTIVLSEARIYDTESR